MSEVRRPKLLFLAWNFPPVQAIASVRTWNVAKYLSRLGWDVTVVTPRPELWRHLESSTEVQADIQSEGIRQILTDHDWRFLSPIHLICWDQGLGWLLGGICRRIARARGIDDGIGWIKPAERACLSLGSDDVDLILATGPPFAAFTLAERLSRRLNRPYVLDYRDPWIEPADDEQQSDSAVNRREARLLAGAAAVTTVSQSWAMDFGRRFNLESRLQVVTNGYDPEEMSKVKPHDFGHFAIVYAGIFYPPERVITPLLAALKLLDARSGSGEWYFHYYGHEEQHVRDEAVRLGVSHRVKLHGKVPRSEALSATRGANIAVVITSVFEEASARVKGWVPAKLYEMIGLGTPILLIGPPGTDVESIARTGSLASRFNGEDIDGIRTFIEQFMAGGTFEKGSSERFGWKAIAKAFDVHLRTQLLNSGVEKASS